jgi:hypothetical protein
MRAAASLLAVGYSADALDGEVQARLCCLHGPHLEAVLAGEETPDLPRLAALAVAEGLDPDEAFCLMLRDVDDAIFDVEHRLAHPGPEDNPRQLKREIRRLKQVRDRREIEWSDTLGQADYTLDAILTYAGAAAAETIRRPTASYAEAVAAVEQAVNEAFDGTGPKHQLIIASCGTRKTHHAVMAASRCAAQRHRERREWLDQFYRDNPGTPHADAVAALDREGPRPFRVLYLGERHEQVREAVNLARQNGMRAEHWWIRPWVRSCRP